MITTENIGLTQFVASDKPTWLGSWNENMRKIDDFAGEVKEAETQTESTIDDIRSTISSMQAEVTSAQQELELHSTRLTNLESDVTGISTDMTKAQNDIISLFNKEGATGGILSAVQHQLSAVNSRSLLNTENITNLQSSQNTQDGILETLDNRVTALEEGGSGGDVFYSNHHYETMLTCSSGSGGFSNKASRFWGTGENIIDAVKSDYQKRIDAGMTSANAVEYIADCFYLNFEKQDNGFWSGPVTLAETYTYEYGGDTYTVSDLHSYFAHLVRIICFGIRHHTVRLSLHSFNYSAQSVISSSGQFTFWIDIVQNVLNFNSMDSQDIPFLNSGKIHMIFDYTRDYRE